MKLRRYCVTVLDNWTPKRHFWTRRGAERWMYCFAGYAYLFAWDGKEWRAQ